MKLWRVFAIVATLAMLVTGGGAYWYWNEMQTALDRKIVLHEPLEIYQISKGTSLSRLALDLENKGWLENAMYLRLEARRLGNAADIKAGVYEIRDGMTPRALLATFVAGQVKVFTITFIEGVTFHALRETLASTPGIEQTITDLSDRDVMARISSDSEHPEGRFFPSTYHFNYGDTDIGILKRAHRRMQDLLAFHWASRAAGLPYTSSDEALIMASIIEKETGSGAERARVAGVFVRRLQKGMKLQTDPTVIYGIGQSFDGNLRRVDLTTDTPYNTYTRHGLPPTPIAMPGEASIKAALHPAKEDVLYFVGKGNGTHVFSKTLKQHNAAVRRYQLGGKSK